MTPSREARKNRRLRIARKLLLVLLVLVVAGVGVLYWFGRSGGDGATPRVPLAEESVEPQGELVTVGQGFERSFSEGERPLFTIKGESYAVDRSGVVFLEGVDLTIYRENGDAYRVASGRARFVPETKEAILAEGVTLSGPGGLSLETRRLIVGDSGRLLESAGPVEFELGPQYGGRADRLRTRVNAQALQLTGRVRIRSIPGARAPVPFSLAAQRVFVERDRQLLRAEGEVELRHLYDVLRASRVNAFLAEDERTLRFVRARNGVSGHFFTSAAPLTPPPVAEDEETAGDEAAAENAPLQPGPPAETSAVTRVEVVTEDLRALFSEDGSNVANLEIEGGPEGAAELLARTVGEPAYRIVSRRVVADLAEGTTGRAEAAPGVLLETEIATADPDARPGPGMPLPKIAMVGPLRRLTGARAELGFTPAGAPQDLVIEGGEEGVLLTDGADPSFSLEGARARFDLAGDAGEVTGDPVVVTNERGRIEAPKILYTRESGIVHGMDGVRARLDDPDAGALGGTPLASFESNGDIAASDDPVWVESDEGFFRQDPRSFLFRGSVRAWRGDSLLVADELRGDDATGRLTASGSVRTLWTPTPDSPGDGGSAEGDDEPGGPLEVTARRLVHEQEPTAGSTLVYTGDVVAVRDGTTLACQEMNVRLAAQGGEVERILCTGAVRIADPAQGRELRGGRADYDVDARQIVVTAAQGGAVTMKDREGNEIQGPRMIYDIDADRVRVLGAAEASAGAPPDETGSSR